MGWDWITEPAGDLWDAVKRNTIDQVWPPDSEQDAWDLADQLKALGKTMDDAADALEAQAKVSETVWLDVAGVQYTYLLRKLPEAYRVVGDNMRALGDGAKEYGDSLREARINIIVELAANAALYGALMAFGPAGGFLAQGLARAIAGRLTTMIGSMIGRTAAGGMSRALSLASRLGVEAGKGAIDEALINTTTQLASMAMGTRDNFDFGQLGKATVTGGVGEVLGEGVGKIMSPLSRATNAGLNTIMPSGVARNLTAGISGGANNFVTSPSASYIVNNYNNPDALTNLGGYANEIRQNGAAAAITGAPRSMTIDHVQQMHPNGGQIANDWADRWSGNAPTTDGAGNTTSPEMRGVDPRGGQSGGNGQQPGGTPGTGGAGQGGAGATQPGAPPAGGETGGNAQTGGTQTGEAGGTQTGGAPAGGETGGTQSGGAQPGAEAGGAQTGDETGGAEAGGSQTGGAPAGGGAEAGGTQTGGAPAGGETGGTQTGGAETGGTQTGGAPAGGESGGTQTGGGTGGAQAGGAQTGGAEAGGTQTGGAPAGGETGGTQTGGGTGGAQAGGAQTGGETGTQAGGPQTGEAGSQTGGPQANGESGSQSGSQSGGTQAGGEAGTSQQGGTQSGDPGGSQSTGQTAGPDGTSGNANVSGPDSGATQSNAGNQGASQSVNQTVAPTGAAPVGAAPMGAAPAHTASTVPTHTTSAGNAGAQTAGVTGQSPGSQPGASQAAPATGQSGNTGTQTTNGPGKTGNAGTQSTGPNQTGKAGPGTTGVNQSGNNNSEPTAEARQSSTPAATNAGPNTAKPTGTGALAAPAAAAASLAAAEANTSPANEQRTANAKPTRVRVGNPPSGGGTNSTQQNSGPGQAGTPAGASGRGGNDGGSGTTGAPPASSPNGNPEISVNKIRKDARRAEQWARNAENAAKEALDAAAKARDAVRTSLAAGTEAATEEVRAAVAKTAKAAIFAENKANIAETAADNAERSAEAATNQTGGRVSEKDIQRARDTAAKAREAAAKAREAAVKAWQAATTDDKPPPVRGDGPPEGDPNRQPDDPAIPVQPEVHVLGTYSADRLTVVDGVITEIDGQPVEKKLRELAKHRAELYFRAKLAMNPTGKVTGDVVAVVLNGKTGQVFEATNGQNRTEIPNTTRDPSTATTGQPVHPVHPELRAIEGQLRKPDHYPADWNDDGTPRPGPKRDLPGHLGEPLFRHAEVRAANEHLHVNDDVALADLIADVWFTHGDEPALAPFCTNCSGLLSDVRSLSGERVHTEDGGAQRINTRPPALPDTPSSSPTPAPTGTNPAPTTSAPTSAAPAASTSATPSRGSTPTPAPAGPATSATPPTGTPTPSSGTPSGPTPPTRPAGGSPTPGPRSRVESVRPVVDSLLGVDFDGDIDNREVERRARAVITGVAEDVGVRSIDPNNDRQQRFTVTRNDDTTFVVRVISKSTGSRNLARIVHRRGNEFEIRVSPRADLGVIERVMANAVAQANAIMDGAPTTNLLDGRTHPGSGTTLSAEDQGRQAEVRYLDRAKRETSRLRTVRRHRVANEMRTLVEHLGLHPDDHVGPQRRAVSDVEKVVDKHVKEGGRRPAWALPPDGFPKWKAFLKYHLPAEVFPGSAAAAVIATAGGDPMAGAGVAAATVTAGVSGTFIKHWYDRRQKTNVDAGHGDRIKIRARELGKQFKELHDPIHNRLNIDNPGSIPAEPPTHLDEPPGSQPRWARLLYRGGPATAGVAAASPLYFVGLPGWNIAALGAVAGVAAVGGTIAEKYLGKSVVEQEWARLDNIGLEKDQKALEFIEYNAKRLSAIVDRLENLRGLAPKGTVRIATIAEKHRVNELALRKFGVNQADQFGNLGRSSADSTGKLLGEKTTKGQISDATWNTAYDSLKTGALRSAVGMIVNAILDVRFTAREYNEITRQVDHDSGNKMAEQVKTQQRAIDAMLDELTAKVEEAEAAKRIDISLTGRIAHIQTHPPRPPWVPQKSTNRPPGHQDRKAFRALAFKQAVAMETTVGATVIAFNQGWELAAIIGGVAVAVGGSFKLRFLFRRSQQRAVDETIKADRKKERVVEEAEAEARQRFDTEYMLRKLQAFTSGQTTPPALPAPQPDPGSDPDPDQIYASQIDALVQRERETMFEEERPWTTLNQRLLALDRLSTLAERSRVFVQHKLDTGDSRPLDQARKDLNELVADYKQLKDDGSPMPDDHERQKPEGARSSSTPGNGPASDLKSYLHPETKTRAGRAFFPPGEQPASARTVRKVRGQYTIDMHGFPDHVSIGPDRLTADDLAALIEADPRWHGQPIRLLACETGQRDNGFAQQLADRLGVRVYAPTDYVFIQAGRIVVSLLMRNPYGIVYPKMPPTGRMRAFDPAVPRKPGPPSNGQAPNALPNSSLRTNLYWPDHDEVEIGEMREMELVEEIGELALLRSGPTVYTGQERLWPDELANLVAESGDWTGGPARIQIRDGHVDPEFAQRFADLLGVPVLINASAVAGDFATLSSGTLEVYNEPSPIEEPAGAWRVYEPRNVAAGKETP